MQRGADGRFISPFARCVEQLPCMEITADFTIKDTHDTHGTTAITGTTGKHAATGDSAAGQGTAKRQK